MCFEKKKTRLNMLFKRVWSGDGEIRTLETLLTPTRFPVVRPRPARRHLHIFLYAVFKKQTLRNYLIVLPSESTTLLFADNDVIITDYLYNVKYFLRSCVSFLQNNISSYPICNKLRGKWLPFKKGHNRSVTFYFPHRYIRLPFVGPAVLPMPPFPDHGIRRYLLSALDKKQRCPKIFHMGRHYISRTFLRPFLLHITLSDIPDYRSRLDRKHKSPPQPYLSKNSRKLCRLGDTL